jgi:hypothetical protein
MKRLRIGPALLAIALLVPGCGSGDKVSSESDQKNVLAGALISLNEIDSAHFETTLTGEVVAKDGGTFSARLNGDLGEKRASLAGTLDFQSHGQSKQSFSGGLRLTSEKLFVGLMNEWYVSSLAELKALGEQRTEKLSESPLSIIERLRARSAIQDIAESAFVGEVSDGPVLDGVETVRWEGTLNPEGVLDMALKYGGENGKLDAAERQRVLAALEVAAKLSTLTVIVGSEDGRPRQVTLSFEADQAELAEIAAAAGETSEANEPEKIDFELQVDVSRYDEEFSVTEPQGAKPMEELLQGIFGG